MQGLNNQILQAFRPFHWFLVAYNNSSEFCGKNRWTFLSNIARSVGISILLFTQITNITTGFLYCVDSTNNLKEIALPSSITICGTQVMLNYISIVSQSRPILELIERVRRITNDRKLYWTPMNKFNAN